jgi:hypothetical protein
MSSVPTSTIPFHLQSIYRQARDQQSNLTSLKSNPLLHQHIQKLLDNDNDDNNRDDFASKVWEANKDDRSCGGFEEGLFRFVDLCSTDFWGTCFQTTFRQDHERSFWVERITI